MPFGTFFSDYFWDSFSLFAPAGLDHNPSIYASCSSCDDRWVPPHPDFSVDTGSLKFFFFSFFLFFILLGLA
jgi:hypothetical protein